MPILTRKIDHILQEGTILSTVKWSSNQTSKRSLVHPFIIPEKERWLLLPTIHLELFLKIVSHFRIAAQVAEQDRNLA